MQIRPNFLQRSIESVITFLYPAQCKVCEEQLGLESAPYICNSCWKDIEYIQPPWCEICGIPNTENLCNFCATKPPRFRTYPHFFLNACVVVFIGFQCCHVSSSAVRKFISLKQVLLVNKSNASCVHTSRIIRLMTLITE